MLENLYAELETHLVLLGATAVEDRLQEGVI
jgi:magnesium-transporting ATPase (P-type)